MGRTVEEMMGINGVQRYGRTAEVARKAGISRSRVTATKNGREGLSLKAARAVAEAAGNKTPVSLYVLSQMRAMKAKITAGGDAPGQAGYAAALRGIAAVVEQLEKVTDEEISYEKGELEAVLAEFTKWAAEVVQNAGKPGYPESTTKATVEIPKPEGRPVERDTAGRVIRVGKKKERDVFGRRM